MYFVPEVYQKSHYSNLVLDRQTTGWVPKA